MSSNDTYCSFWGGFAKIYALCDKDDNVFYIGCTTMPIEGRLKQHISDARNHPRHDQIKLNKIRALNFKISVKTLDIIWITGRKCNQALNPARKLEKQWINKYISLGIELTNVARAPSENEAEKLKRFNNDYHIWSLKNQDKNLAQVESK